MIILPPPSSPAGTVFLPTKVSGSEYSGVSSISSACLGMASLGSVSPLASLDSATFSQSLVSKSITVVSRGHSVPIVPH